MVIERGGLAKGQTTIGKGGKKGEKKGGDELI